jgi:RadC-like JAB domain
MFPDDHKQALCTYPNPRPPLFHLARKYKLNQVDTSAARLMHNHPSGDPTPSRANNRVANRPTRRGVKQEHAIAVNADERLDLGDIGSAMRREISIPAAFNKFCPLSKARRS